MSKTIYLATTEGCASCRIMLNILTKVYEYNNHSFGVVVTNYTELPSWISTNVPLTDFPTIIFVEDDVVKYHFSGTKGVVRLQKDIIDFKFN